MFFGNYVNGESRFLNDSFSHDITFSDTLRKSARWIVCHVHLKNKHKQTVCVQVEGH
jgi:hypothetical protein